MTQYTIVGDAEIYGKKTTCLCCVCGGDREHAEEVLEKMLTNPTKNDIYLMRNLTNLRIHEETKAEKCWWNDPFLAN